MLYVELVEAIRQGKSLAAIGALLSRDPAMSAKMLQIVNSAFFGLPRRISDPAQAATCLGLDQLRTLVLDVEIFSACRTPLAGRLSFDRLWAHSLAVMFQ